MASNYSKPMARDRQGEPIQSAPAPFKAFATYGSENATASSVITANDNTTTIEVSAQGGTAFLRWVPSTETAAVTPFASVISAAGTANFDHVIPSGSMRRFIVPIELAMVQSSVVGANVQNGLYKRYAIKSVGVASVLTNEY